MTMAYEEGAFLGLQRGDGPVDIAVVPLAYELTTSYGMGTCDGPLACLEASAQVELYDDHLGADMPAGCVVATELVWEGTASTLRGQLDELAAHALKFYGGELFPLFLGGEHGILPPIMHAARHHPAVMADLSNLTLVQIDAHADLRDSLDDEVFSHACAASRSLDLGVGKLLQAGVRAYSQEEHERIKTDDRIMTYFAKDTQHPHTGHEAWQRWLAELNVLSGPVHLTLDIDGLEGALVPATGTPVPGGLSYWQVIQTIETLFSNPNVFVISADVNEIVPQSDSPLTQFTAACLSAKILACHVRARQEGHWRPTQAQGGVDLTPDYFSSFDGLVESAF